MDGVVMESQTFDEVFDALANTPVEAADMKARADLLAAVVERVKSWRVSQEVAAERLRITWHRLNDLMRGKLGKFLLDAPVNLTSTAGLTLVIRIGHAA